MGYEQMAQKFQDAAKAYAILGMAIIAWLFGGSFRQAMADGYRHFFPQPQDEAMDAETDRIEDKTREILASLAPEPDVLIARRFLNGEMTADISTLGVATARRLLAMRVQGIDVSTWTDRRLEETMRGRRPEELDRRVMQRIVDDLDFEVEQPALAR